MILNSARFVSSSPFKRQMSLRISELPSNLERTRAGLASPPRTHPPLPALPQAQPAPAAKPDVAPAEVTISTSTHCNAGATLWR